MKSILIGDTHYGVRQDNPAFYDYQKKFFHNILFPYMEQNNIEHIVHFGDLVDNRTKLSYMTKTRMEEDFLDPLKDKNSVWITGNHDSFFKNTLQINAMDELVRHGSLVCNSVQSVSLFSDFNVLCVPWICSDNRAESVERISQSSDQIVFGHLELKGFKDNSGNYSNYGDDRQLYGKFNKVFSGHFHKRTRQGNISFIGAPFEFTWADAGDYRGFAVFDSTDFTVTYIRNPYRIFNTIDYSDVGDGFVDGGLKDTYCRLIVKDCSSEVHLRDAIKRIEDIGVLDLTVIDGRNKSVNKVGESLQTDNLRDIMHHYIQSNSSKSDAVQAKFDEIYNEVQMEIV